MRVTGLLGHGPRGFILTTDDSALWVIESDLGVEQFIGETVVIEGSAIGFDRLRADWVGRAKKN